MLDDMREHLADFVERRLLCHMAAIVPQRLSLKAPRSMRRLAFDRATLFEEHVTDGANGFSQKIAPLILGSKQNQFDKALPHFRDQVGQIDRIIPFNVLSHHIVYLAVQAALR
jgi:hypothetical protein